MAMRKDCARCQGAMTEGFVPYQKHNGANAVPGWYEGPPEKSFWFGLKLRGRRPLPIQTFRCSRCGHLESYAPN